MQIALYQPDIPQNLGSILRLCACMGAVCHIIEPCGFILDDKRIRRVAMDYVNHVELKRHTSWEAFLAYKQEQGGRLILLTTKAERAYYDFTYAPTDILLLGRESAGVPPEVAQQADVRLLIPMQPEARSLNVAMTTGIVLSEALRQLKPPTSPV